MRYDIHGMGRQRERGSRRSLPRAGQDAGEDEGRAGPPQRRRKEALGEGERDEEVGFVQVEQQSSGQGHEGDGSKAEDPISGCHVALVGRLRSKLRGPSPGLGTRIALSCARQGRHPPGARWDRRLGTLLLGAGCHRCHNAGQDSDGQ